MATEIKKNTVLEQLVLIVGGGVSSNRRHIQASLVRVNGQIVTDIDSPVTTGDQISVGKRLTFTVL